MPVLGGLTARWCRRSHRPLDPPFAHQAFIAAETPRWGRPAAVALARRQLCRYSAAALAGVGVLLLLEDDARSAVRATAIALLAAGLGVYAGAPFGFLCAFRVEVPAAIVLGSGQILPGEWHLTCAQRTTRSRTLNRHTAGSPKWLERCTLGLSTHNEADPEAQFLAHWSNIVFAPRFSAPATDPPRWMLVTGGNHERGKDHSTDTVLAELERHPHATDDWTGAMVGILPRVPVMHPTTLPGRTTRDPDDATARHLTVLTLDTVDDSCAHGSPSCPACTQRMADLLVFLCRGAGVRELDTDARRSIVDNARRLVRSHTTTPA